MYLCKYVWIDLAQPIPYSEGELIIYLDNDINKDLDHNCVINFVLIYVGAILN